MAEMIIEGSELLKSIKIGVRMPRCLGLRMAIAMRLFQLAGWVSGTTVVVEIDDDCEPLPPREPSNTPWNGE